MKHNGTADANIPDAITDSPVAREVETKETASNPSLDRWSNSEKAETSWGNILIFDGMGSLNSPLLNNIYQQYQTNTKDTIKECKSQAWHYYNVLNLIPRLYIFAYF